jgi:hypothetical protein
MNDEWPRAEVLSAASLRARGWVLQPYAADTAGAAASSVRLSSTAAPFSPLRLCAAMPKLERLSLVTLVEAPGVFLGIAALSLCVTACGGGGSTSSTTKSQSVPTTPTTPTSTTASSNSGGTASVTTGPVRGTLHGANHAPKAGKPWPYSVTVADAAGHPLSGTVDIQFAFGGQVVGRDRPPTHPFKNGRWHDNLQFPAQAVGFPLTFQAVVHTRLGSITLDWPVRVQR